MTTTPQESAHWLLEVVPMVMRDIRSEMRSRRSPDLTVPQFRALGFVNRNHGSSLSEVANHMGLTPPSACRLVDGLITRGMMTRQDNPTDRRRIRLAVTPHGSEMLRICTEGTLSHLASKLSGIDNAQREIIAKAMATLRLIFATTEQKRSEAK